MTATTENPNWFHTAVKIRGTVLPIILPRILVFAGFGLLVSLLHALEPALPLQTLGDLTNNVACNLVLGLLLVFRTNTAYERFWEGRKAWGRLVVHSRNLARQIQTTVQETKSADVDEKQAVLRLLGAFAIATKLHLRRAPITDELVTLLSPDAQTKLRQAKTPPLQITLWLSAYLQQTSQQQRIDSNQRFELNTILSDLVEDFTTCERILSTPMPIAYAVYLKRLILLYCLLLPFSLVERLGWLTGLIVALISFVLLGMEEIGNEIEDPFGSDPNDLPLDTLCATILEAVESTIQFQEELPISFLSPTSLDSLPLESPPLESPLLESPPLESTFLDSISPDAAFPSTEALQ